MALIFSDPSLAYEINRPLMIEASAGSGKTTILTERWVAVFIYLLAWERLDPSHALSCMAALTFSRKAAAEMKERIRIRMDELFDGGDLEDILRKLQAFQREPLDILQVAAALRGQKSLIDDMISAALIGTIDSFVLSSLRQNPLEMEKEIPIEPEEGSVFESEVQKLVLRDCIGGNVLPPLRAAFEKGVALCGFKGWIGLLETVRKKASSMGEGRFMDSLLASGFLARQRQILEAPDAVSLYGPYIEAPMRRLREAMRAEVAYAKAKKESDDPYFGLLAGNKILLAGLEDMDETTFMGLFQKLLPEYGHSPIKKDPDVQALREASRDAALDLADACTDVALSVLMPLAQECRRRLDALRSEEGRTSFSENTEAFLKALREGPMAEKLQSRLRYFFADEFQDTSPDQYEIFSLIGEKAVPFYVGDPKQSIYRFRGADVAVFQRAAEQFQSKGWRVAILRENRRSVASHVHFVNAVFSEAFGEGDIVYTPQEALKEGEGCLGYTAALELPPKNSDEKVLSADQSARAFEDALAFIRLETAKGTPYGDILVLFRTRGEIKNFYYHLKNEAPELPVSSSQREELFQSKFIIPLIHFLRVIDNPADELSLITLLKSLFFRMDDIRITELLHRARTVNAPLYEVLPRDNQNFIEEFSSLKNRVPLEELLDLFLQKTAYEAFLAEQPGEALATLRLFREELQGLGLRRNLTLETFLRMIDTEKAETREAEFSGGEGKNILLLTIHGAKGLESPCVVYVFKDGNVIRQNNKVFPLAIGGRIAFDTFGKGRLAEPLRAMEEAETFAEEKRLAYVALTRAKSAFYLCGLPEAPEKPSPLKMGHILNRGLFSEKAPLISEFPEMPPSPSVEEASDQPYADRLRELSAREAQISLPTYPQTLSVSQLLDAEFSPEKFSVSGAGPMLSESLRDMGDEGFELSMPSSADIGTMMHSVLQQFDFAESGTLLAYLKLHFSEFESAFPEVERLALNFWNSPFFKKLFAGASHSEKERPVQMLVSLDGAKLLLQSVADLYVEGGKRCIVDYKLSIGNRRERFRRQLSYYGYLSEAAGYPVDELVLFDLKEAKEEAFPYNAGETKAAFEKAARAALGLLKTKGIIKLLTQN